MKTIKQLLRQPVKTAVGILMVALAFAILVTCVGQYTATDLTRNNVENNYDTVALLSEQYFWEDIPTGGRRRHTILPEKYQNWIDDTLASRTDLVKLESYSEVYSAYIPSLSPDNFSQYENGDWMDFLRPESGCGNPYRCAVFEVTLTKVGTILNEDVVYYGTTEDDLVPYRNNITLLCVGTVERVIGLEEGFTSPVGKPIALCIKVFEESALEALDLAVGQRYLVYGMDYTDVHGEKMDSLIYMNQPLFEELFGAGIYDALNDNTDFAPIREQIHGTLTVCNRADLPILYRDKGQFVFRDDLREFRYRDTDGIHHTYIPTEEFSAQYTVPTIAKLEGTAEEFLATEQGTLWNQVLAGMEIQNHGFPVLAVDKLGYQTTFSQERTRIVEGRDFSEEERENHAKVCIISQQVAVRNGLSVGDTIDMRTYAYDLNIDVQYSDVSVGSRFPSAAIYSRAEGFTSEMASYTIVGLYRQEDAWQNREDSYGITPNVIFVPKGSITGDKLTGVSGIYYTVILHNGKMEAFQTLMEEAGYPDLFICYDQGYSEIMATLDAYEEVSKKALYIGLAGFSAVVLLFLFLYPNQQKRALRLMGTLGASSWARLGHTFGGTLCILVPGALLGGFVGERLWQRIAAALMEWVNVEITLDADMSAVAPKLTAVGLAGTALLALLVSATLSRTKGLLKRK